jgi:hypothetical protein
VYRYEHAYRHQRSRIRQPHLITLWLALIATTVVMALTALTLAFLLTGWPLS